MGDVIRFPPRPPRLSDAEKAQKYWDAIDRYADHPDNPRRQAIEAKHRRWAKWRRWKDEVRHWGGGHRRKQGPNSDAIGTFTIDRTAWTTYRYQLQLGTEVLNILWHHGLVGFGNTAPHGIYRQNGAGEWRWLISDRQIKSCLNQHLAFVRYDNAPVDPPRWLASAVRDAALDYFGELRAKEANP
jgi:hypothetical protein